jgi:Ca-activated chloride channel family protein
MRPTLSLVILATLTTLIGACSPGDAATSTTSAAVSTTADGEPLRLVFDGRVDAGTRFEVRWSGPTQPEDWVALAAIDSPATSYISYFNTSGDPPGQLVAPVEEGEYEIRYVDSGEIVVTGRIRVLPLEVTLEAPEAVEAGDDFEVTWIGPDGPGDYVTIVAAGSPPGAFLDYGYTTEGSPLTLTAPEEPGDYEIRYATERESGLTLATIPIEVR